jgi:hypothetical protein
MVTYTLLPVSLQAEERSMLLPYPSVNTAFCRGEQGEGAEPAVSKLKAQLQLAAGKQGGWQGRKTVATGSLLHMLHQESPPTWQRISTHMPQEEEKRGSPSDRAPTCCPVTIWFQL